VRLRLPWAAAATALCLIGLCAAGVSAQALARHPKNPRYLVFRGRPTILVGSGEHYGAVLNPDFDQKIYLDTIAGDGLNLTRLFVGTYYEQPGAFGICNNTLAPAAGRALTPWVRSDEPGAGDGGRKFDLARWNDAYFERLRSFVSEAGKRGIAVEVVLFSSYYGDGWPGSPLNAANNVNGIGDVPKERANTLDNGNLLAAQERVVRKIVGELRDADNVYYEIQNEPWADHEAPAGFVNGSLLPEDLSRYAVWKNRVDLAAPVSLAWQAHVANVVADEEKALGVAHLVAQNYCSHRYPIHDVDPHVGVMNFHYAWPEAATLNLGRGRVVSFDETGFANPTNKTMAPETDAVYRRQAWEFLMAGGGIFSLLDYSFTVGHEDGTFVNEAPGGGSPALRRQLRVLKEFLERFEIPALRPRPNAVIAAPGAFTRALGTDEALGVYVWGDGHTNLSLDLGAGTWQFQWIDTKTGAILASGAFHGAGGRGDLESPTYEQDVALRISRVR
jgi:hypothetical protein